MEHCPTQAVLPLVGLAAENVIRDRYNGPVAGGRRISAHPFLGLSEGLLCSSL
ncbi:MAG: hypothetical protein R6U98_03570 [Pirellulaceae bacterium]